VELYEDPRQSVGFFVMGLDLGQAADYSACSVVEIFQNDDEERKKTYIEYDLRLLRRFELGLPYPTVCDEVERMLTTPLLAGKTFLGIDICGVGAGIADMFRERDLRPIAIRSHGGNNVTVVESEFRMPKRDMIGRMRMLFQQGRLRISSKLRDVEIFKTELRNFRMKISQSGHDTYEHHRANMHDDLLISAGMACWLGMREEIWRTIYGDEETPPELLEMMRQIDADPLADERELRRRQSPTYDGRPIF